MKCQENIECPCFVLRLYGYIFQRNQRNRRPNIFLSPRPLRARRLKYSIKCAHTSAQKTANFKKSLLLFSPRVTRIQHRASRTFFASNAQVPPSYGTLILRSRNFEKLIFIRRSLPVLCPVRHSIGDGGSVGEEGSEGGLPLLKKGLTKLSKLSNSPIN